MAKIIPSREVISYKEIVGYIFIGLWVLLLAASNYPLWMSNYLPQYLPEELTLTVILLLPVALAAFIVTNNPAYNFSRVQLIINTAVIIIGAYIGYLLILNYFH